MKTRTLFIVLKKYICHRTVLILSLSLSLSLRVCVVKTVKNTVYLRKYEIDKMVVFRIVVFNMYISSLNSAHKQASKKL